MPHHARSCFVPQCPLGQKPSKRWQRQTHNLGQHNWRDRRWVRQSGVRTYTTWLRPCVGPMKQTRPDQKQQERRTGPLEPDRLDRPGDRAPSLLGCDVGLVGDVRFLPLGRFRQSRAGADLTDFGPVGHAKRSVTKELRLRKAPTTWKTVNPAPVCSPRAHFFEGADLTQTTEKLTLIGPKPRGENGYSAARNHGRLTTRVETNGRSRGKFAGRALSRP